MKRLVDRYDRSVDALTRKERVWNSLGPYPQLVLGKITAATAISNFRWTYTWDEASITGSTPAVRTDGLTDQTALSVSELSNGATPTTYAYGVPSGDLPAGFAPKAIPVGTYVILSAFRLTDGTLRWLIINTQAISGTCP